MADRSAEDQERINDLIVGSRILAHHGILDGFGHASVRSAIIPSHFFMTRRMAPALVTKDSIIEFDADSMPIDPSVRSTIKALNPTQGVLVTGAVYGERPIHGEIYRVREDVEAIIHSHCPAVIPFGVSDVPFRPIMHMAGFLPSHTPVFEIRDVHDTGGMLVLSNDVGAALAKSLASAPVVLMRGHGQTVVGRTMKEAVFRAIYAELNARLLMQALQLTKTPVLLSEKEIALNRHEISDFNRPWELWKRQINES